MNQEFLDKTSIICDLYERMVEYVYLDAIEPYDKYNLFITENKGQLLKPMRYFDRNFEYVRESPMSVLGSENDDT
jgi:hypothetical protein